MATKARKAKKAKKTSVIRKASAISKRASVINKGASVISKKWIIDAITRYRGHLLVALPPDWSGGYTISNAPNAIKAIVLDGVNPNKFTLTKLDIGIAGVDAYLCTVPAGRQNSYWNNTVFIAVGDVALTPVSFTDIGGMDVDAPYPAATLANPLNFSLLAAAAMPNVYSQTERLLGAVVDNNGKIEYLGLYRLRHSLDNSGDVIFVELYDPTTQVNGGFPGGVGAGTKP